MPNKPTKTTAYYGAVINPESLDLYSLWPRALLAVYPDGYIAWIEEDVMPGELYDVLKEHGGINNVELVELGDSEFILPGFIDTHTHAPQIPNMGSGQQYELIDWLKNVTFPTEERFGDVNFAKKIYPSVVRRFINHGTTTCCYYGSLHAESTKVLADVVLSQGQRALIGKCNMDSVLECPKYYREASVNESIKATKELIAYIRSLPSDLIRPILTPRFALSCTHELLCALGELAQEDPELHIQTHISENTVEIEKTLKRFACDTYAGVYCERGLLTPRTILAHGVHLKESELQMIKSQGAGISHCPTSNFNLRSGMANVGKMLDKGIKVGLGTDVSGGFSLSMLTAIQHASMCSKMVAIRTPSPEEKIDNNARYSNKQLTIPTLLYLATVGGAQLCCLEDKIGSFAPGKSFDALLVSMRPRHENLLVRGMKGEHGSRKLKEIEQEKAKKELDADLERFLFCGDDRNILKVFVQGKLIGGTRFKEQLGRRDTVTRVIVSAFCVFLLFSLYFYK